MSNNQELEKGSIENIVEAIEGLDIKPTPIAFVCGRGIYNKLSEHFETGRSSKRPVMLESLFSIKVYLDKGLEPNEWKFVYREEDI